MTGSLGREEKGRDRERKNLEGREATAVEGENGMGHLRRWHWLI
jgi:hypothetical protein